MPLVRIIGPGRAGRSMALALAAAGWPAPELLARDARESLAGAAHGVDFVVLATPDRSVADVAAAIEPDAATVLIHLSGSLGLSVLAPHRRRAVVHPLVSLPDPDLGARRLRGAWFAVSHDGDAAARAIPDALGGRILALDDDPLVWARYHAAACIASNHLVALLGQVERVAALAGVPLATYLDLARSTVDNVAAVGPVDALTGPAARGDDATIARHLAALPDDERGAYLALLDEARKLAAQRKVPVCS